jgi:hypothetical protein
MTDTDSKGHGTCMLSIAGGPAAGVNKEANLIPVRIWESHTLAYWLDILDGLGWIINDAHDNELAGKAVLSMSFSTSLLSACLNLLISTQRRSKHRHLAVRGPAKMGSLHGYFEATRSPWFDYFRSCGQQCRQAFRSTFHNHQPDTTT